MRIHRRLGWLGIGLIAITVGLSSWSLAQPPTVEPPVTTAEAEATRPGVPPAPVPPSETLGWMFTFGVLANYAMKKMRDSAWFPMVKEGAGKVNVAVAGVLSALAAAGIHSEFDQVAGTLVVTGLTWAGIAHFGGEWVRQWALQQWMWHTTKT